jgi:hypothetical protein
MRPMTKKYGMALSAIRMIDDATGLDLENMSVDPKAQSIKPEQALRCCINNFNVAMFDRKKVNHFYDEQSLLMEDYLYVMQAFDMCGISGFISVPLYHYYKRAHSLTTPDVSVTQNAQNFIAAITSIRQRVSSGEIEIKSTTLKAIIMHDLNFYEKAEQLYMQLNQQNQMVSFQSALKQMLA